MALGRVLHNDKFTTLKSSVETTFISQLTNKCYEQDMLFKFNCSVTSYSLWVSVTEHILCVHILYVSTLYKEF